MAVKYGKHYSTVKTSQQEKIPGTTQQENNAGGFSWRASDWTQLERFLVLGSEGGTYYATEKKLTVDNCEALRRCISHDGVEVVKRIVAISQSGLAAKNDPALFALAMALKLGNKETRFFAQMSVPKVARTGTHLFHLASYVRAFGGWGRGTKKAFANWYQNKSVENLAYIVSKYQSRDGWSNRDILRLAHPKTDDVVRNTIYKWITTGELVGNSAHPALKFLEAFEEAKKSDSEKKVIELIQTFNLPRECIPTKMLTKPAVWEALLPKMGIMALIRNLGNISKSGLLTPMSKHTNYITSVLQNVDKIKESRTHPLQFLMAYNTYKQGRGVRGSGVWQPIPQIVSNLEAAFYSAFKNIEPTNKNTLLALDVSGSMSMGEIQGMVGITPRIGSAVMAMVTARTEPYYHMCAFSHEFINADITARSSLSQAIEKVSGMPFGRTDCSLPMMHALENKWDVDTFVIYTDSESYYGDIHPSQALDKYRQWSGKPAKLIVVGMVSNGFTLANPNDPGMLDIVGFSSDTPAAISYFSLQ